MSDSKAVKERIEKLIAELPELSKSGDGYQLRAWLTAALNAVDLVCLSANSAYFLAARQIINNPTMPPPYSNLEMAAMMGRLLEEIEGGLLTTIENRAIGATFDDFLDHGEEYLKHGRKNEAGVIAGIVFEDTLRRICRVLSVTENGIALDTLISELAKRYPPVLTATKAKRARAAADLRTSAAHARWEQFELGDVAPVIELTKELIGAHLA